jgi:hypothetical protein
MIRLDVRAGFRGEHRERRRVIALSLAPNPGDGHERGAAEREAVLGFWVFRAG